MGPDASVPEFLATCWTTAGNVRPPLTGPLSPVPLEDRIQAASRAGFRGIGFTLEDILAARESRSFSGIETLLKNCGLRHLELEFLDNWWTKEPDSLYTRARMLEAANALGARHIKVGAGLLGQIVDRSRLRDELHELAEEAIEAGVRIALEAAAFSMLPTIEKAVDLVRAAEHPNAGLMLDVWHLYRSGSSFDSLAEIIPQGSVFAVELDDGLALPSENLYEDTFDNRELCGYGDFNVVAFIRALQSLGYGGPWGVEMMSIHHRSLDPETAAHLAIQAAADCYYQALGPIAVHSFTAHGVK